MNQKFTFREELLAELLTLCAAPADLVAAGGLLDQLEAALCARAFPTRVPDPPVDVDGRAAERGQPLRPGDGQPSRPPGFEIFSSVPYNAPGGTAEPVKRTVLTHPDRRDADVWQQRPLEPVYLVVFFNTVSALIRQETTTANHTLMAAVGIRRDGSKEVLGLWFEQKQTPRFWNQMLRQLKNRGVEEILVAVTEVGDGLPAALARQFPRTQLWPHIPALMHMTLALVKAEDRRPVRGILQTIYLAASPQDAEARLESLSRSPLGEKYPQVVDLWQEHATGLLPSLAYPQEVRQTVYVANEVVRLFSRLNRICRNHAPFPSEWDAFHLLHLAVVNLTRNWRLPARRWKTTLSQFAASFPGTLNHVGKQPDRQDGRRRS